MAQTPIRVRKAVLPAAGLGTRFLPATKAQPKEMLPVVDKPLIQYVVEECVASGIENIIIVTGRGKNAIEDHFDSSPELESFLESKGKSELAELVHNIGNMVHFSYTRQKEARLDLNTPCWWRKELVGNEPFAVLLGDVIIPGPRPATKQLIEVYETTGKGAIAVEEVPREKTGLYGIVVDVEPGEPGESTGPNGRLLKIRDLVEKPNPADAPSNLGVTGRYVLPPEIFDCLERTKPGRGGEIQLTDGLRLLQRWNWDYTHMSMKGNPTTLETNWDFLKPPSEIGLENAEFGGEFRDYLRSLKLM